MLSIQFVIFAGCSKCLKEFATSSFESKTDFSGYDTDNWEPRTNDIHRLHANSALNASCKTQLQQVVRDTGARYSALYQLPYYDAVRFLVIDPMHCLFLGIAKHCLTLWKQEGLLIPSKVATGFSGFSADQWKNWVCYYSLFALKGILPSRHYDLWSHYVSACRYMCSRSISPEQCANAEKELLEFCKGFQSIYGAERCTPNMHLSCHLGDCVKHYGPVYGFWCFSFERFNGIMGNYHKNNHNIGVQFMRKFTRDTRLHAMPFPDNCKEMFSVLPACSEGSVADTLHAGCSKCLKEFATSSFESKTDFSGYDTDNWEPRTNDIHRLHANSALNASCKTQLQQVVRDTGARYSALYQLPYYDAEALNFLLEGKLWAIVGVKQEGLLSDKDFRLLQIRVDAVVPPPEIGRIPSKVATGFSGFSADQWKNWVCYYSLFALKGILPSRHYDLWSHYVSACRYMCSRSISPEQCANAEKELLEFCKGFQSIYGAERCTPNMHLSCHLGDCVKDYGPVYGFWCFSFERFNGIMGNYHKNNHNIGCSKCLKEFATSSFESKTDFSGYDTDNWEPRTNDIHRLHANSALNASCKTQLQQVVRDTGARYSALYQLPYYDAVRFLVIDPMHCLFLGIAKHCLTLWKQEGLLSDKDFRLL
ncbi:predicted protein [Nematostella vectensis]|uniref:Transposase domain-containing protein n=1 Tax=Nematostella vectensis TaxID=45351 RepID=A7T2X5_NEMVE|nr:predicted protein [Nematostella vectensis]|eukprot:XP_001621789.1 hypothetical protein NEMVEDRAFT_v1g221573 [Nematostella vectensis]